MATQWALSTGVPTCWAWAAALIFHVQDAGRLAGAFQVLAQLEELPRLAVRHGPFADAVDELVDALDLLVELAAVASYSLRPPAFAATGGSNSSRSHMSALMTSRMIRAFSRAAASEETMLLGLAGSHVR